MGSLFAFAALAFVPQTFIVLESVQFVTNVIFARLILGEKATPTQIFGTFLIIVGNTMVIAKAPHGSHLYGPKRLWEIYTQNDGRYYAYLLVGGGIWCVGQAAVGGWGSPLAQNGRCALDSRAVYT